jgi:uncharacterized protein HemY
MKKNMVSPAIQQFESAVKAAPDDPVLRAHLGLAYVQAGDWGKAKQALNKAFELKADFEGAAEARKALSTIGA